MSFLIPQSHLDISQVTDLIESDSTEVKLNTRLISMSDDGDDDSREDTCREVDITDLFQSTQVNLIQIPSNANVIQVPSDLLAASHSNLILCLPPEGITFQVQSTSPLDSSMETSINEIYDPSYCNPSSLSSSPSSPSSASFTTLTPITFPDVIQKPTTAFGETIEVSPEIQLEKAQTWHKDSQLAIVALAALKATNN